MPKRRLSPIERFVLFYADKADEVFKKLVRGTVTKEEQAEIDWVMKQPVGEKSIVGLFMKKK